MQEDDGRGLQNNPHVQPKRPIAQVAATLIMRRLLERLGVWRVCRPEFIKPIGKCAAAGRKRVDLPLLQQDGLSEFLQGALEVGELYLDGFESCGIIHQEIISA
jgi:hypothetical protein